MSSAWPRIRRIVEAAMECAPRHRDRLLDRACRGDAMLRRQVDELLAHENFDERWLASPVPGAAADLLGLSHLAGRNGHIGRYRVCELIAVGGMAVVYRGIDDATADQQPVAIKVLPGGQCTRRMRGAFRREQRVLKQLDHPNITRILDSGFTPEGLPYIAMDYVDGRPIDEYVRRRNLSIDERLELFCQVCTIVHFAHQNLIVHRDLKPSNIFVGPGGAVKLLDFGIAKIMQEGAPPSATATETMMNAMTLRYSSPEQIRAEPITTATDVYSLGVILFELLTGRPPYDLAGKSCFEAGKIICEAASPSPRTVLRALGPATTPKWRSALDRIVLMAMHKEPRRRYASAEQFAQDIRRHLDGATVMAYKAGRIERILTTVCKHRVAFGTAAASFAIVSTLAIILAFTAHSATVSRDREMKARQVSQMINGFMNELLAAAGTARPGQSFAGLHLLQEASCLVDRELSRQPDVAASIYMQIGSTYYNLRRDEEAIRNLHAALACFRGSPIPDKAALAECLGALGAALTYRDEEEGLNLQREALALKREMYGDNDRRTADSMHGLAFALTRCARPPRYQEAEELYRAALTMRQRLGAGESAAAAENIHALAALMRHQGRLADSAELYARALDMCRRTVEPLSGEFLDCLNDYAICLRELGNNEKAEAFLNESFSLTAKSLGDLSAACVLSNLASVKNDQNDQAAAWRTMHRALALLCRAIASGQTGSAENSWRRMMDIFDQQAARPLTDTYREFITRAPVSNAAGSLPANVFCCVLHSLAGLAAADHDFALAEGISREVIRVHESHDKGAELVRARYQRTRADALVGLNRVDEARSLLESAHRAFCDRRGPDYRESRSIELQLAKLN